MARTIFLFLVLLNTLALAWLYLKGDERFNAGREPQRANTELAAGQVRLLPPADIAAESCHAYVGASAAEAQEITKAWSEKLPAAHIAVISVMPKPVFDMAIIGLASRDLAETKLAQLKRLGAGDGAQIKEVDSQHFSVLIATFTERGAAEDALKNAALKGVRSAVIVQRQAAPGQSVIEVRSSDAALKTLTELAAARKGLAPAACATP